VLITAVPIVKLFAWGVGPVRNPVLNTGWRLFSSRLGIEPKTPWWLVQAQPLAQRGSGAHPGRGFVLLVYFPNTETMSPYLENTPEKRSLFDTYAVKDGKGQGPKCHTLALSHLEPGRAPTASMPAAACSHCILHARNLGTQAFVFCLCRWSANFWRLLVVYQPQRPSPVAPRLTKC